MNHSGLTPASREVRIPCCDAWLYGDVTLPANACGLVLFVDGSGSGRHSGRHRLVALKLQQAGIATLLFNFLTAEEEKNVLHPLARRFDVATLTQRLQDTALWAMAQPGLSQLPVGYFGAGTGAAAAIIATARPGGQTSAVVSCGGRPDLAGPVALAAVTAPTLLIVGSADHGVLESNKHALAHLGGKKQLAVVDQATHLFEERGALEQVAELAASWFGSHLAVKDQDARTQSALPGKESA